MEQEKTLNHPGDEKAEEGFVLVHSPATARWIKVDRRGRVLAWSHSLESLYEKPAAGQEAGEAGADGKLDRD